ncbi:hypothetical protein LUW75_03115 [Streptomyces sp. MRC013]|uniref:hypothetical protein n=1 Tax=Streptomyces sp. MRC013 TaxID=2898276 RepID=UPI0020275DB7|nr:hypothetical protein [Streptomyces sp. MRC013]URM89165.1 hypothetical protein LUW75_03115 [Streptomyces sp. MRC013]
MGAAGPGGRYRLGRLGASLLLLLPVYGVTAASGQGGAAPRLRAADAAGPRVTDAAETRVVYAGTRHRSLGGATTDSTSAPLFGAGPAHFDVQPSALGDRLVFASRRDDSMSTLLMPYASASPFHAFLRPSRGSSAPGMVESVRTSTTAAPSVV